MSLRLSMSWDCRKRIGPGPVTSDQVAFVGASDTGLGIQTEPAKSRFRHDPGAGLGLLHPHRLRPRSRGYSYGNRCFRGIILIMDRQTQAIITVKSSALLFIK